MPSLGIDIGGTSVKAALIREGDVVTTARSEPFSRPDTNTLIEAIGQAAKVVLEGMNAKKLSAVGICCPGLLDRATRTITLSVNVPGLVGRSLDELLREALDVRALPAEPAILSDASAVAFDLYLSNKLTGRLLSLALGTGVGASVIDDFSGSPTFLHVSGESPGHFGQVDVSLDGDMPIGPDGGRGSLEAYIGAAALIARYGSANVIDRLTLADAPVRALIRAIRIAHAIYRPHHIALAGGVGTRLRDLTAAIHSAVGEQLTSVARPNWRLVTGDSDFHAACGIARYAMAIA